ncbi:hypothetical protein [Armatimonas sp.]|uniref:hypothetical protein n=1 Tax=Armatimonas sp. TaxID=1872638 RepID=UPI00286C3428|nr:hypothetical protein [Armatimonas sp.]
MKTTARFAHFMATALITMTALPALATPQNTAPSQPNPFRVEKKASAKPTVAPPVKPSNVAVLKETKENKAVPLYVPGAPAPEDANYTGVVIDCTGMGLTSSPCPKLYDEEGIEVYGTITVTLEYLFDYGVVAYPRSLEAAINHARIGRKPMIIKALRLDKETRSEPVISQEDAKRLREANAKDHFLERCAVVFVIAPR